MARDTYVLKAPLTREEQGEKKTFWLSIGRATKLDDGRIICTMESVPTNWDGVFYLMPKEK